MSDREWTLSIDQAAYDMMVGLAARLDCRKEDVLAVSMGVMKALLDARDDLLEVVAIDPTTQDDEVVVNFDDMLRRGAYRDRDSWGPTGPGG